MPSGLSRSRRLFFNEALDVVQIHGNPAYCDGQGFVHSLRINLVIFVDNSIAEPGRHGHFFGKIDGHHPERDETHEGFVVVLERDLARLGNQMKIDIFIRPIARSRYRSAKASLIESSKYRSRDI